MHDHATIFDEINEVFGDETGLAREWLVIPLPALNGNAPQLLLNSDPERVLSILQRIKSGDFS